MVPIFSLFLIIMLSIVITRIATIALIHTGLSRETARFQARSALTGSGFTTSESEQVVNHPVRRKIILFLMLLGHAGIVTVMSSLILTFIDQKHSVPTIFKLAVMGSGVGILWWLSASAWVDRYLSRVIEAALKRYTKLEVSDYASLLHLSGEYRLAEIYIEEGDWLAEKSLNEAELWREGIRVLGVRRREGLYIGTPDGEIRVHAADCIIVYGRVSALQELDERKASWIANKEHQEAIIENEMVKQEELKVDARRAQE